jgi:hypothetical protein
VGEDCQSAAQLQCSRKPPDLQQQYHMKKQFLLHGSGSGLFAVPRPATNLQNQSVRADQGGHFAHDSIKPARPAGRRKVRKLQKNDSQALTALADLPEVQTTVLPLALTQRSRRSRCHRLTVATTAGPGIASARGTRCYA